MIVKLSDDNETLINPNKISFLRMNYNYHEDERTGKCSCPIAYFEFTVGVGIDKINCSYSVPLNAAGEPDVTKNAEIWSNLRADYEALEKILLNNENN